MLGNVKTFLWRTLYLQTIRRHFFNTGIEILLVGFITLYMVLMHTPAKPLSKDSAEEDASAVFGKLELTDIVYAPKSDYNDELMRAVGDEVSTRHTQGYPSLRPGQHICRQQKCQYLSRRRSQPSSMLGNVKTFLWRTLYLQTIRRHFFNTGIEILLVGFITLYMVLMHTPAKPLSKDSAEEDASAVFGKLELTDIVYAPKSDYNDELMRAVGDEVSTRHTQGYPSLRPGQHICRQQKCQYLSRRRSQPSSMLGNVKTFLWRTLYLQTIRRHFFNTGIEILLVGFITLYMVLMHTPAKPLSKDSAEEDASAVFGKLELTDIVYAPKSDYNDELMRAVGDEVSTRHTQGGFSGKHREPSPDSVERGARVLGSLIGAGASDVSRQGLDSVKLHPEADADAVIKKCTELRGIPLSKSPLCVNLSGSEGESASLAMTLYVPSTSFLPNRVNLFPLGSIFSTEASFDTAMKYQYIIEQAHLRQQSKRYPQRPMNEKVSIDVMPGWVFEGLKTDKYAQALYLVTFFAFFMPMIRRINAIQQEFTSGTAEHQCVMGLTGAEFFWGHFLTAFIIGLIESFFAISIMFLVPHRGQTYAEGMNLGLVIISFIMFQIQYSMLIILITWVFPKGWVALIMAILITFVAPSKISDVTRPVPLPKYFICSKTDKLLASLLPTSALYSLLRIVSIARDYEGGSSWFLVTRRLLGKDNVTIGELWAFMVVSDVVMAFLAWYLSKVLPWSTDNRQSPMFCLMPSYWKSEGAVATTEKMTVKQDAQRFEEMPPGNKAVIATDNLTKVYGYKPALNGVNLKVYETRITVLLGHNGAGKTTLMSILTGMLAPTSGAVRVCGYNVASQREQVRQRVSFCQQKDIFFEDMTCVENLLYFGSLKKGHHDRLMSSIQETLRVVGLEDKVYNMPSELSGGMKRRLSIAMTLVSDPEVLILDEPTAGLDPETRRIVWDTLQNVGKKKTLLISSHDMEEADAIADQIIIMASGVVVCSGSTAFLKTACGVGYKLTFIKVANAFKLNDIMNIVRHAAPAAIVDDDKEAAVSIALGTLDNTGFPAMFRALESSLRRLGIASIGVTVASMKDVYLKFHCVPINYCGNVLGKDIEGVCKPITKRRAMARSFGALFRKRFLSLLRSWDLLVAFGLVPLLLLVLLTWSSGHGQESRQLVQSQSQGGTVEIAINMDVHFLGSTVLVGESPATDVSRNLRALVESQGGRVLTTTKDVRKELQEIIEQDFSGYLKEYAMIVEFKENVIRMMANPTSAVALAVVVNLVDTARLRALTAQPTALIDVTIAYLPSGDLQKALAFVASRFLAWQEWMFFAFTYSLAFAAYSSFPVAERLSGARDVQLMTGISGAEFIFAHFVFDFLHHALFSVLWCAIHYAFISYPLRSAGFFLLTFLSAEPLAIAYGYVTADTTETAGSAVGRIFTTFFVGGAATVIARTILVVVTSSDTVDYVAILFGPYALLSMLLKVWNDITQSEQCKLLRQLGVRGKVKVPGFAINCHGSLLEFSYEGLGYELLIVLVEGLLLLAIVIFWTSGYRGFRDPFAPREFPAEEDVEEEKRRVNAARQQEGLGGHSLLAWSLHKRYGNFHAVRGMYMALRPSECFGLLGVNGAGKTTTFQMLAALISVTYGDACTAVAKLSGNVRKWQSQVSYCFQLGGLLDRLNAYEYLYLVGRLRGIPESELKPMVDSVISVVDLDEHAPKECGVYSGGNRRKLSIGAALLGLQPFVFLDEPYAGVDVVSRNKIFRAIAEIKKCAQTTFVLTSQNMDECEFSCDRITIMVNDQATCLGTLQRLREKFGQGYRLEFLLKHTAAADAPMLKKAVAEVFPTAQLKDDNKNLLGYHLMKRMPWSKLFTMVGQLQQNFPLEHVLVGENTLEDIFLNFARLQGSPSLPGGFA
ncbi:phospholipid-transporting ATPase ABCA3-like isoform X2 [Dermacentor albipictus]|uniref:phospholipid-transporting ATPase ABCA3-like isoform X2 n=1 Tax=Dermacentor albipictus TaxID=60249 RepID=UPI0038FC55A1